MPQKFALRAPLRIAAAHLSWRPTGDVSLRGHWNVAGGPQFFIDAVKQSQATTVRDFAIDDGGSSARLRLRLAEERVELSFNGELTAHTLDKVFTSSPLKSGSLRGKIQANFPLADPFGMSARGQLSATQLPLLLGREQVLVEKFAVDARGDSVLIRSAEVRWRNDHFSLAGSVAANKGILLLDLDVAGDRVDLSQAEALYHPSRWRGRDDAAALGGAIRFKAGKR
jgi:hypothetical protein